VKVLTASLVKTLRNKRSVLNYFTASLDLTVKDPQRIGFIASFAILTEFIQVFLEEFS